MYPELTREEYQRYSRHLLIPEVGLEGQRKLKSASVLIIGTGGLGSPTALYLAAAGIGHIGLVDYDVVDSSNLQRQIVHGTDRIGQPKVESARRRLLDLNPNIEIDVFNEPFTSSNAFKIADSYEILVDGTDNFPTRYLINDLCVLTGKPYVFGSIYRFEGQASVFDARKGPCYRCLFPEPPPPGSVPSCGDGGVFGVLPGTIGTIQATEVIKYVAGIGETLIGRLLLYDALEMSLQTIQLQKNPHCRVCGTQPEINELVDYEAFCGTPIHEGEEFPESPGNISPLQLSQRLLHGENIILIDVREPHELRISHLPNAKNIPLGQLGSRMDELSKQDEIVLFCRSGTRSKRGMQILSNAGFQHVNNLLGGINAWTEQIDPDKIKY